MKTLPKKPTPPGKGGRQSREEVLPNCRAKADMGMDSEERMEETMNNYYKKNKDTRMEEKREAMMGIGIPMRGMSCGGLVKK